MKNIELRLEIYRCPNQTIKPLVIFFLSLKVNFHLLHFFFLRKEIFFFKHQLNQAKHIRSNQFMNTLEMLILFSLVLYFGNET